MRGSTARVAGYGVLVLLAVFSLGPLVVFVFNALKSRADLAGNPIGLPRQLEWHNFLDAWQQANMAAGLRNSLVIVVATVAGVCVIAGCAAYAMARLDLPGGRSAMTYLVVSTALPMQMFLVPLFYLWTRIGLYDNLFGLVVIYWALFSPLATLLLRSFMVTIPREYEEAARCDGASELRILVGIVLPLSWPGFLTIGLITGLSAYNEFLFAVTFIQTDTLMPVATSFFNFQQGYSQDYTLISAAGLIMLAPMLLLFFVLQRRFVSGIASTNMGAM